MRGLVFTLSAIACAEPTKLPVREISTPSGLGGSPTTATIDRAGIWVHQGVTGPAKVGDVVTSTSSADGSYIERVEHDGKVRARFLGAEHAITEVIGSSAAPNAAWPLLRRERRRGLRDLSP